MTSRLSFLSLAAVLAALFLLSAGPASAASSKVLLLTRNEEGNGPPAVMGEPAHVSNFVQWGALNTICGATDEGGTMGKNPSGTVKVSGSDVPLSAASCFNLGGEEASGAITIKSVSISQNFGVVTLKGRLEVETLGCHYRATKLLGKQSFGENEEVADALAGTAKLVKKDSAQTCAPTTAVEDFIGVADAMGYNYVAELTS